MKERIKEIMSAVFGIKCEEISNDASTDTCENWDSLNHMNLIVAIEEEFSIRFLDDEIIKLNNLEALENRIQEFLSKD